MPKDRINVGVAHLNPHIELDQPDAVHSVGVSELSSYLKTMYGEDVPHEEKARRLSGALLSTMTELSIDEELPRLATSDPIAWLPRWLQRVEPVASSAKSLGKYINKELILCETDEDKELTNDITFVTGLYDLTSFVLASELALDHPRYGAENLMERSRQVAPAHQKFVDHAQSEQKKTMEFLSSSELISPAYRRRVAGVRHEGEEIIVNTENYIERLRELAQ
jgi:hypothetical protein